MADATVPCCHCGRETGMQPLDARAIPPGCRASLVVACARCLDAFSRSDTHDAWTRSAATPEDAHG